MPRLGGTGVPGAALVGGSGGSSRTAASAAKAEPRLGFFLAHHTQLRRRPHVVRSSPQRGRRAATKRGCTHSAATGLPFGFGIAERCAAGVPLPAPSSATVSGRCSAVEMISELMAFNGKSYVCATVKSFMHGSWVSANTAKPSDNSGHSAELATKEGCYKSS